MAVLLANVVYLPFRLLKIRKKASILSRQADEPTLDISMLANELKSREIKHVVLSKKLEKSASSAISYALHMLAQMYCIATSEVVIIDGYCILASILKKKKGQKIVQIWHSLGAIKKFGWQTVDKQWGSSWAVAETMKLHGNYDHVIAPSELTAEHFSEAFGIDKDKIKLLGLPRIDYLLEENQEVMPQIRNSYPQVSEKQCVLYAPTFRKNSGVEITELIDDFDFNSFNLVLKKHWLDKTDYSWAEEKGVIIDDKFSSIDWMKICSKVITDYSAISLEAAIMDKELYLYMADEEEYEAKVGVNIDFESEPIKAYMHTSAKALCENISDKYDMGCVRAFKGKYITVDCNDCTGQLVDFIESLFE